MKVKFKKLHKNAVTPSYAKEGDAGMDLVAVSYKWGNNKGEFWEYDTGIAVEIPKGYVGLLFPRSSISKKDLLLANSVGVIDSSYRGSIKMRFKEVDIVEDGMDLYKEGDKIGQLIILPYPQIELEEVKELTSTDRGEGGFGSTGN